MRLEDFEDTGCLQCGAEIPPDSPRPWLRIYCSARCRNDYLNGLEKSARLDAKAKMDRRCAHCSAAISPSRKASAVYCSKDCKGFAIKARWKQRRPLWCLRCGETFTCATGSRIYCSDACQDEQAKIRAGKPFGRMPPIEPIPCRWCNTLFTPRRKAPIAKLCSTACYSAERIARPAGPKTRACVICSGEFRPRRERLTTRTCSIECKRKLRVVTLAANRSLFRCDDVTP